MPFTFNGDLRPDAGFSIVIPKNLSDTTSTGLFFWSPSGDDATASAIRNNYRGLASDTGSRLLLSLDKIELGDPDVLPQLEHAGIDITDDGDKILVWDEDATNTDIDENGSNQGGFGITGRWKYVDLEDIKTSIHGTVVSDDVYGVGWNSVTGIAPSKNAVYDKIESLSTGGIAESLALAYAIAL